MPTRKITTASILLFFLFLQILLKAQCLTGTYTIGGSTPNFLNFTSAVQSLSLNGVCGPVTFLVRPGTYNEQVLIPAIVGSSATNVIEFRSENGSATSVILQYASQPAAGTNYCLALNGASFVKFREMTIERTGSDAYATVIHLQNGAHDILVEGNSIQNDVVTANNYARALVNDDNSINYNLTFKGNIFDFGATGLYLAGPSVGNPQSGLLIEENVFRYQGNTGIRIFNTDSPAIRNNYVSGQNQGSGFTAIRLQRCSNTIDVSDNELQSFQGIGIRIDTCALSSATPGRISNNMVARAQYSPNEGIGAFETDNLGVYFNTVYSQSPSGGYGIRSRGGSNQIYKNNISIGGMYSVYFETPTAITASDYNDFYASNLFSFRWGTNTASSLSDWQTLSGQDANSISILPQFSGSTNLHINFDYDMNGKGTPIAGITMDFDGDSRNALNPDMGADEFDLLPNNLAIIDLQNPVVPICAGNQIVTVRFRNTGNNLVSSALLQCRVNGQLLPATTWTGSLSPGDTSLSVALGTINFLPDSSFDIQVWTQDPNGFVDAMPLNDTLQVDSLGTAMVGTYTIGQYYRDYKTFPIAVQDLSRRGVCGHVNFEVMDSVYSGAVVISKIPGSSPSSRIAFSSEYGDSSKVIVRSVTSSALDNYAIKIDGAEYISFKQITFTRYRPVNWGPSSNSVILLADGASNIKFEKCAFTTTSQTYSAPSGGSSLIRSTCSTPATQSNDSIQILNCRFSNASYGIYFDRVTGSPLTEGIAIKNNIFEFQSNVGIEVQNTLAPFIENNWIQDSTGSSNGTGIIVKQCPSFFVNANRVDVPWTTGVLIQSCSSSVMQPGVFSNNMIATKGPLGLYLIFAENVNVYHNSIRNFSPSTTSKTLELIGGNGIIFRNNILVNSGAGRAFATLPTGYSFDYNLWYNAQPTFSTSHPTFAAWQGSGQDLNGQYGDPNFRGRWNLHVASNSLAGNAATLIPAIARDIDGEYRNMNGPDIGADEFWNPSTLDVSPIIFNSPTISACHGGPNIRVSFKNYGATINDTLRSFLVYTKVNNTMAGTFRWTGTLAPGDTLENLLIANYPFLYGTNYTIKVWTAEPNYASDANGANDTLAIVNPIIEMGGIYSVGRLHSDFQNFNEAKNAVYTSGVCDFVVFEVEPGIYYEFLTFAGPIPGVNASRYVEFRSATGDKSSVELNFYGNNWFLIDMAGCSNIRFRNLTIGYNSKGYFDQGIKSNVGCTQLKFIGNTIKGRIIQNTSVSALFQNNLILGRSMRFRAGSNNVVEGNKIMGVDSSIAFMGETAPIFRGNSCRFLVGEYETIYLYNSTGGTIEKNDLFRATGEAIYVLNSSGTVAAPIKIYNNRFGGSKRTGAGGSPSGILRLNNSNYVNVYHNTMWLDTVGATYAIRINLGSNINIVNNIIGRSNYPLGPASDQALISASTGTLGIVDHNMYYNDSLGSIFGTYGTNVRISFNDWKLQTGKDQNSIIAKPTLRQDSIYTSVVSNNYYYDPVTLPILDRNELYPYRSSHFEPACPTAYDGTLRNTTSPMYGAEEYIPFQNNAAVFAIDTTMQLPCPGNQPVKVWIQNGGLAQLQSLQIKWKMNNVAQPTFQWTGNLPSGDSLLVQIGTANYVAYDSITYQIWSEFPNGFQDPYTINDTVRHTYATAMSGIYTIGGVTPDFNSFSEAIRSLHYRGVCGPVVVNVRPGTYTDRAWFSLTGGVSNINTITFQSELLDSSTVNLQFATYLGAGYILDFARSNFVTFRHISMKNTAPANATINFPIVHFANSNDIVVEHCKMETPRPLYYVGAGDNDVIRLQGNSYGSNDRITIRKNLVIGGQNGLSATPPVPLLLIGLVVEDNTFWGQTEGGINLYRNFGTIIDGNVFLYDSLHQPNSAKGILVDFSNGPVKVINNKLLGALEYGIYIKNCSSSLGSEMEVYNNEIALSDSGFGTPSGIIVYNSQYLNFDNNSILSTPANVGNSLAVLTSSSNIKFRNNMMSQQGTGKVFDAQGITSFYSNNNNLHCNGNMFGQFQGVNASNLSNWRIISGQDSVSFSLDPLFTTSTDLHFNQVPLENRAIPLLVVQNDRDGNSRSASAPDLGCYEESLPPPAPLDIALFNISRPADTLCNAPADSVFAQIKNWGTQPLTFAEVHYSVDGNAQNFGVWSGSLPAGGTTTPVFVGVMPPLLAGNHVLKVWTALPNGGSDPNVANDSLVQNIYVRPFSQVNLPQNPSTCSGTPYSFSAPFGFISYQWINNGVPIPGANGQNYSATIAGTYTVAATDNYGCLAKSDSSLLAVQPLPAVAFSGLPFNICSNVTPVTMAGNQPSGSFFGNGVVGNQFDPVAAGPGYHVISYIGTNTQGCTDTITQGCVVFTPVIPTLTLNGTALLAAPSGFSYQWFNQGVLMPAIQSANFNTQCINGIYSVIVEDLNHCFGESLPYNFVCVGIDELQNGLLIELYPNPAYEKAKLILNGSFIGPLDISLYDLYGKKVDHFEIDKQTEKLEIEVCLDDLPSGSYIFKICGLDLLKTKQLIKY